MSQNTKSTKGYFIGFLAGGVIGAAVTLLTTPKSGANMRKEIKQKSDEYFDEVDKYFSEAKQNANKMMDESRRKFATILHDIKSKPEAMYKDAGRAFNDAKGKTIEVFNSGKERVETETEKLTSSVKAGLETNNDEKK
ncbi:MAG: YtxH domain-containing protein [Melioribacteraceae bacterium]|nr:YtxH domain-containing protein [Melioribacteraceae bacterium]